LPGGFDFISCRFTITPHIRDAQSNIQSSVILQVLRASRRCSIIYYSTDLNETYNTYWHSYQCSQLSCQTNTWKSESRIHSMLYS